MFSDRQERSSKQSEITKGPVSSAIVASFSSAIAAYNRGRADDFLAVVFGGRNKEQEYAAARVGVTLGLLVSEKAGDFEIFVQPVGVVPTIVILKRLPFSAEFPLDKALIVNAILDSCMGHSVALDCIPLEENSGANTLMLHGVSTLLEGHNLDYLSLTCALDRLKAAVDDIREHVGIAGDEVI